MQIEDKGLSDISSPDIEGLVGQKERNRQTQSADRVTSSGQSMSFAFVGTAHEVACEGPDHGLFRVGR